jgi:hypothetical protein
MSDILYWREYFGDTTFLGQSLAEGILTELRRSQLIEASSEGHLSWPDIGYLSWADIADLRDSPLLRHFRDEYGRRLQANSLSQLRDDYQSALEQLADAVRPSVKRELGEALLTNVPLGPLNPFGLAQRVRDVRSAAQLRERFGRAFFVRETRFED